MYAANAFAAPGPCMMPSGPNPLAIYKFVCPSYCENCFYIGYPDILNGITPVQFP